MTRGGAAVYIPSADRGCRLSILLRILHLLSKSSQYPFEIDTTIALFSQIRQLRLRGIE